MVCGLYPRWPSTARLHRRARIETSVMEEHPYLHNAPPAFTGGRGLKHLCRERRVGQPVAPPAFTGGGGLKPVVKGHVLSQAHAPPAFTGGRGLKRHEPR